MASYAASQSTALKTFNINSDDGLFFHAPNINLRAKSVLRIRATERYAYSRKLSASREQSAKVTQNAVQRVKVIFAAF
jgi:hypothetical protein